MLTFGAPLEADAPFPPSPVGLAPPDVFRYSLARGQVFQAVTPFAFPSAPAPTQTPLLDDAGRPLEGAPPPDFRVGPRARLSSAVCAPPAAAVPTGDWNGFIAGEFAKFGVARALPLEQARGGGRVRRLPAARGLRAPLPLA
jgi:hypothetical protein